MYEILRKKWRNNVKYLCECGFCTRTSFTDPWIIDFRNLIEFGVIQLPSTIFIKVCNKPMPSDMVAIFEAPNFSLLLRTEDWELYKEHFFNAII